MSKLELVQFMDNGAVQLRYKKDDGSYHRTVIPADCTDAQLDLQLTAVDNHLAQMGFTVAHNATVRSNLKSMMSLSKSLAGKLTTSPDSGISIDRKMN